MMKMMLGLLAPANADAFAINERTNSKKKVNGRRIFELLQIIGGATAPARPTTRSFAFGSHIEVELVPASFYFAAKLRFRVKSCRNVRRVTHYFSGYPDLHCILPNRAAHHPPLICELIATLRVRSSDSGRFPIVWLEHNVRVFQRPSIQRDMPAYRGKLRSRLAATITQQSQQQKPKTQRPILRI